MFKERVDIMMNEFSDLLNLAEVDHHMAAFEMTELADSYYYGPEDNYPQTYKVEQSYPEAIKWYKKAAELGGREAAYDLGMLYYKGEFVKQSISEAKKWLRKGACNGDLPSGKIGLKSLKAEADQGDAYANYVIARHLDVIPVEAVLPQDLELARTYLVQAAEQGHEEATKLLSQLPTTEAEAFAWNLEEANGHKEPPDDNYVEFTGVTNRATVQKLQEAAERDNLSALLVLGCFHQIGYLVPHDDAKAEAYLLRAAEEGLVKAQIALAEFYLLRKPHLAKTWFTIAWKRGSEAALGNMVEYWQEDAAKGNAEAQYQLGKAYSTGLTAVLSSPHIRQSKGGEYSKGLESNLYNGHIRKCLTYLHRSADLGYQRAQEWLESLCQNPECAGIDYLLKGGKSNATRA